MRKLILIEKAREREKMELDRAKGQMSVSISKQLVTGRKRKTFQSREKVASIVIDFNGRFIFEISNSTKTVKNEKNLYFFKNNFNRLKLDNQQQQQQGTHR
jgi:hypothetical protein